MRRPALPIALAAVASLALPALAHAAPGDFDPAFNNASPRLFQLSTDPTPLTVMYGVAAHPDGGVVASGAVDGGASGGLIGITKHRANGEPDPSFSDDGRATFATGIGPSPGGNAALSHVAVLPDGRILASGVGTDEADVLSQVVIRLRPDGTLDPTFSGDGRAYVLPAPAANLQASGLALAPGGQVLVSGDLQTPGGVNFGTVTRLNADGSVDGGYGTGGSFVRDLSDPGAGNPSTQVLRGTVDPDGSFVAAYNRKDATDKQVTGVLRLTPGGELDPGFGDGGLARLEENGTLVEAVRAPSGRIFAGGTRGAGVVLGLEPRGTRAQGFGEDGVVRLTLNGGGAPGSQTIFYGTDVQPNGRVVLATAVLDGGLLAPGGVTRLTAAGVPDPSFGGGDGYANQTGQGEPLGGIGVDYADGRLWVTGAAGGTPSRGFVARYAADSGPTAAIVGPDTATAGVPATFDASGSTDDAAIASYAWDLDGDGAFDDAMGPTAAATFPAAGTATVRVRVTDDVGQTATAQRAVTVAAAPTPPVVVPPVVAASKATLVSKRLSVDSKGRAVVKLRCSAVGSGCAGKLSIRGKLSKRGKTVTLGKRSYKVAAGRTGTVLVTLTKATRRVVRVRSVTKLKLAITPTGAKAATSTVTLRRNAKVKR